MDAEARDQAGRRARRQGSPPARQHRQTAQPHSLKNVKRKAGALNPGLERNSRGALAMRGADAASVTPLLRPPPIAAKSCFAFLRKDGTP